MSLSLIDALTGISGILVTPFDSQNKIAPERLAPIIDRALAAGMHIPVVNGNTGEFYALTVDEACTMAREVIAMVGDRAPVLAGVGRGIEDAKRIARVSVEAGAAGLMIHQPPDPFVSPRGVVAYVEAIAQVAGETPLMLYLRNDAIGTDTIAKLCAIDTVRGVKWATPNPLKLADAIEACPDDIVWVGG